MGGKKKKATLSVENSQTLRMPNGSITARNLRSKDLKGVIFGCTHYTIQECLSKQLFGLPASHYAYVRNIYPGMALFLFNYSDRKLHGIFEAKTSGQMRICPYAWSADASEPTQYPAQVRVQYIMQCQTLTEEQFKPVIEKNYYEGRHFWFELDEKQTTTLLSLFSSVPFAGTSLSHNMRNIPPMKTLPDCELRNKNNSLATSDFHDLANKNQTSVAESNEIAGNYHPEKDQLFCGRSFASVVSNKLPLAKEMELDGSEAQCEAQARLPGQTGSISTSWDEIGWVGDVSLTGDSANWDESELCAFKMDSTCPKEHICHSDVIDPWNEGCSEWERLPIAMSIEEGPILETYGTDNLSNKEVVATKPRYVIPSPLDSSIIPKASTRSCVPTNVSEHLQESTVSRKSNTQTQAISEGPHKELSCLSPRQQRLLDVNSETCMTNPNYILSKLVNELEHLKTTQRVQTSKVDSLEQQLAESKAEIELLRQKCKMLESVSLHTDEAYSVKSNYPLTDGASVDHNESLYLVGGYDGTSWLSSLNLYTPSCDKMTSLKPMSTVRSYAPATKLNGNLYVLGGVDSETATCYHTVVSYNPSKDKWTEVPSLKRPKGNLAAISCYENIFAIGGGSGNDCFSEVEMYDGGAGIWIQTRSMRSKRFSPAAAEIDGVVYVVGGYDGESYLKSAERFDYREQSWTRLESMSRARACHSLAVLNERIYALGGYDGTQMVPTVEVFDPRNGKWIDGEEMNIARGYAGAVVLGQSIYIMGGMEDNGEILDTVECYREGRGWQSTRSKALGKRCFFSAMAL